MQNRTSTSKTSGLKLGETKSFKKKVRDDKLSSNLDINSVPSKVQNWLDLVGQFYSHSFKLQRANFMQ